MTKKGVAYHVGLSLLRGPCLNLTKVCTSITALFTFFKIMSAEKDDLSTASSLQGWSEGWPATLLLRL